VLFLPNLTAMKRNPTPQLTGSEVSAQNLKGTSSLNGNRKSGEIVLNYINFLSANKVAKKIPAIGLRGFN